MVAIEVKTGDLEKWADKMEERGAEFAAEVLRKVKGNLETQRRRKMIRFDKIRRRRSGAKRFAIVKDKTRAAELIRTSAIHHFRDIFKENS